MVQNARTILLWTVRVVGWIAVFGAIVLASERFLDLVVPLPSEWPSPPVNLNREDCEPPAYDQEDCEPTPPSHFDPFSSLSAIPPAALAIWLGIWRYGGPYWARQSLRWGAGIGLLYVCVSILVILWIGAWIVFGSPDWVPVRLIELRIEFGQLLIAAVLFGLGVLAYRALVPWELAWTQMNFQTPIPYGLFRRRNELSGRTEYAWVFQNSDGLPRALTYDYYQWRRAHLSSPDTMLIVTHGAAITFEELEGVPDPRWVQLPFWK